jgi:hypothetical protein
MTPVILTIEEAAERAKVTPQDVREWIRNGLRATPVGKVGKRGPANFRIFDSWLIEFMESRAGVARPVAKDRPAAKGRRAVVVPSAGPDPLGPCPKVKGAGK